MAARTRRIEKREPAGDKSRNEVVGEFPAVRLISKRVHQPRSGVCAAKSLLDANWGVKHKCAAKVVSDAPSSMPFVRIAAMRFVFHFVAARVEGAETPPARISDVDLCRNYREGLIYGGAGCRYSAVTR
jgi:hypothetical protein